MTTNASDALMDSLLGDNMRCLDQLLGVLACLGDAQYRQPAAPCHSGIGAHFRHVLDHYDAFLDGVATGTVNYDARKRDESTESRRDVAERRLRDVRASIDALREAPLADSVNVRMDCGSDCEATAVSSVARELQFLVSHTVHHDALIAAAARQLGVDVDSCYGVAPSTLRFVRRAQQAN